MFADEVNNQINRKNNASGLAKLLDIAILLAFIGMIVYAIIKSIW